jgi:hypothetical protein
MVVMDIKKVKKGDSVRFIWTPELGTCNVIEVCAKNNTVVLKNKYGQKFKIENAACRLNIVS